MKKTLLSLITLLLFFFSIQIAIGSTPIGGDDTPSTAIFDMENCFSNTGTPGSQSDYSEFTAAISNTSECGSLSIVGDHLYRENPDVNAHSCASGVDGSIAMCVGISDNCTFVPDDEKAIRFDVNLEVATDMTSTLQELHFYENSPEEFSWIDGASGPNNYPTLYALRVLRDGVVIFEQLDISTENTWNEELYNFSDIPEFTVTETTIFNFELTPYCPIGNGAEVAAWDVDNIKITAGCIPVDGGDITSDNGETEIYLCIGDDLSDIVDVILENEEGPNMDWVITNTDGIIIEINVIPPFDFSDSESGECTIYHIAYLDGLQGLSIDQNINDLIGCYDLSNALVVTKEKVNGGELETLGGGTDISICAGDGISDAFDVNLINDEGSSKVWIITDPDGNIIGLPSAPPFDLEGAGNGVCLIRNMSYSYLDQTLDLGINIGSLTGCLDFSNPITVTREGVNGGDLTMENGETEISICAGDGISDAFDISLINTEGQNVSWIITDSDGNILGLPLAPPFDLEGAGEGTCFIRNISYADGLVGLEVDLNTTDLDGCFSFSNPITVFREGVNGGDLSLENGETEISICVGDGESDAFDVSIENNEGQNMMWIITDTFGNILDLPMAPPFDLEDAEEGTCQIWNVSFADGLTGAEVGLNTSDFVGCFDFSNPITVTREEANGGALTFLDGSLEVNICTGDGMADLLDIALTDDVGTNSSWVITDPDGVVLDLPTAPPFDFEDAPSGTCLIWHLSHGTIQGLEVDSSINNIVGCFDFSNSITVTRTRVDGGMIETSDGETQLIICADDGISDAFDVILTGEEGANSGWVITETNGTILGIPGGGPFDLEGAGPGVCLLRHISYEDGLLGLEEGLNIDNLSGCHDISNAITVTRLVGDNCDLFLCDAEGGDITLEDGSIEITICSDDASLDSINILLQNNIGENSQWVVTDIEANIIALPNGLPIEFGDSDAGLCLVWHLSYSDGIQGLEIGNSIAALIGCSDISNSITVIKVTGDECDEINCNVDGGAIALKDPAQTVFCTMDGELDTLDFIIAGNIGTFSKWIISTLSGELIEIYDALPIALDDLLNQGTYLVYHISYETNQSGLEIGENINDLSGCYDLSNPVAITLLSGPACDNIGCEVNGGSIQTDSGITEVEVCADDGISDEFDVILTNNVGDSSQWIVTDVNAFIISLSDSPPYDFEGSESGICVIWHLAYNDTLVGLEVGENIFQLSGCFDISNPLTVTKYTGANCAQIGCEALGGTITFTDSLNPVNLCIGDGIDDFLDVDITGNSGTNAQWIITDNFSNILSLPAAPPFNFEGADPGICFIRNVSYEDVLIGLEVGLNTNDLAGCFELSNHLTVIRKGVDGGSINYEGIDTSWVEVCVGDGLSDSLNVLVQNNLGDSSQWVITNELGEIISLPDTFPIDFEGDDVGICYIWHLSYNETIAGLDLSENINNLTGCFDFSDSLVVNRVDGVDCGGGIVDKDNPVLFSVGPNPAFNQITIHIIQIPSKTAYAEIYNSQGQRISQDKSIYGRKMTINIQDFENGLYFVKVNSGRESSVKKFVKIN